MKYNIIKYMLAVIPVIVLASITSCTTSIQQQPAAAIAEDKTQTITILQTADIHENL